MSFWSAWKADAVKNSGISRNLGPFPDLKHFDRHSRPWSAGRAEHTARKQLRVLVSVIVGTVLHVTKRHSRSCVPHQTLDGSERYAAHGRVNAEGVAKVVDGSVCQARVAGDTLPHLERIL